MKRQDPMIEKAIQDAIDIVNKDATSNAQRIQKWIILDKDFSVSGGELGKPIVAPMTISAEITL